MLKYASTRLQNGDNIKIRRNCTEIHQTPKESKSFGGAVKLFFRQIEKKMLYDFTHLKNGK